MEAIVLAGGLGTRLSSIVNDVPKCMAPVNEEPFLSYVFDYLEEQGCDHVILSLGYKYESVINWLKHKAFMFKVSWTIEKEPLGTGGGIKIALQKSKEQHVFVLNGDTLFKINLKRMLDENEAQVKTVIALKKMNDFDRYGSVVLDDASRIIGFEEKEFKKEGYINGGIYLINKSNADLNSYPDKFSFEKDFLENVAESNALKGVIFDSYFIDIGIPEDYARAQLEL